MQEEDPRRTGVDEGPQGAAQRRMRAVIENAPSVVFLLNRVGVVTLSGSKGMAVLRDAPRGHRR